jgi:hypothetical protein
MSASSEERFVGVSEAETHSFVENMKNQISLMSVWEVNFVLFNSMLKYVINRPMHAFFHIRTVIIPLPISITHIHKCGVWCSDSALRNFSRCHDPFTPLHTIYVHLPDIVRTGFHSCTLLRIFIVNDLTLRPRNSILHSAKSTNSLTRYIRNYERSTCLWHLCGKLIFFFLIQCWNMWCR